MNTIYKRFITILFMLGTLLLAGCASLKTPLADKSAVSLVDSFQVTNDPDEGKTSTSPANLDRTKTPEYKTTDTEQEDRIYLEPDAKLDEIVKIASNHLALQMKVPIETVVRVSGEPAQWNDLSLACSDPPSQYQKRSLASPISGFHILLSVDGTLFEYHSGNDWLVFCGKSKSGFHDSIGIPPKLGD